MLSLSLSSFSLLALSPRVRRSPDHSPPRWPSRSHFVWRQPLDGFNVGMTVTPHEGRGLCPVVGCREDLLRTCPPQLQYKVSARGGAVVGCKIGCEAFGKDELCCRNMYNSPRTCHASIYSEFFKLHCPATFMYAHDSPSLSHDCEGPKELKVIFCH